nr:MAG: small hydrophobic protein [Bovine orthopneumovirus]
MVAIPNKLCEFNIHYTNILDVGSEPNNSTPSATDTCR